MILKEYLEQLPADEKIAVGASSGWFYFGTVEDFTSKIKDFDHDICLFNNSRVRNCQYQISMLRNMLKHPEGIACKAYINYWKRLIKSEKMYPIYIEQKYNFETVEECKVKSAFHSMINNGYLMITIKLQYLGRYWYLREWEKDHGTI